MTTKQIMKLVDALSEASFEQGLNRLRDFPEQARAAVVAAIEALVTETEFLRTNYTKLKKLVDDGSAYERAYSAGLELMKENESLKERVAALTKDAERYQWLRLTTNWVSNSKGERIPVREKPDLWDSSIDAAITAQKEQS